LGHHVTIITPDTGYFEADRRPESYKVLRVARTSLPLLGVANFMLRARKELSRLSAEEGIDIIHFTFDYPSIPVGFVSLNAPVIVTVHHLHLAELISDLHFTKRWTKLLFPGMRQALTSLSERLLIRESCLVISVSDFTRRTVCAYLGVPPERIRVVYNGVDPSYLSDGGPPGQPPAPPPGGDIVLFVGRLEPSKGLEYLIRAFSQSRSMVASATLTVVGHGPQPYVASLRTLAASLGLGASIIFTGRLSADSLRRAYSSCSMVVLPSLIEGFGISLLEGMAAGKPCLATTAGAIPEVVTDGSTGLLVAPGDVKGLAEAMTFLLKHGKEAKAMGNRGKEAVLRRFTQTEMARRTESVYYEALDPMGQNPRNPKAEGPST